MLATSRGCFKVWAALFRPTTSGRDEDRYLGAGSWSGEQSPVTASGGASRTSTWAQASRASAQLLGAEGWGLSSSFSLSRDELMLPPTSPPTPSGNLSGRRSLRDFYAINTTCFPSSGSTLCTSFHFPVWALTQLQSRDRLFCSLVQPFPFSSRF